MSSAAFSEVATALQDYFDGLYHSDTSRLGRVFHPQARYYSATDGQLLHLDMARYFEIVDQRPAPALRGDPRTDRILGIEFAGPMTAFAKVECSIPPRHFTDFLTLVRLEGSWRVVAKVFHYTVATTSTG